MERITEKIRKLLALANNNSNAHERNAALEQAQKLMAQYNISMMSDDSKKPEIGHQYESLGREIWEYQLSNAVAKLYYCKYFTSKKRSESHCFIGTEVNRNTAIEITTYLRQSIKNEARLTFDYPSDRKDFCVGATAAIAEKIKLALEAEALADNVNAISGQTQTKNGLVHLRNTLVKQNSDYVKANWGNEYLRPGRTVYQNQGMGYSEGKKYGGSLNLDKPGQHKRISG